MQPIEKHNPIWHSGVWDRPGCFSFNLQLLFEVPSKKNNKKSSILSFSTKLGKNKNKSLTIF